MTSTLKSIRDFQMSGMHFDPWMFGLALLASLAASLIASGLYRHFYERKGTGSQIHRAFPLLGIAITTLFIGVQVSLPLSLGLLGALSIIRFRTPIKEPEEVGFIMLVIASAILCATFNFRFLVMLLLIATGTLFAVRGLTLRRAACRDGILIVTLTDAAAKGQWAQIEDWARRSARSYALESSTSRDGVTSLQFSFVGLSSGVADIKETLGRIADGAHLSVYFNRPGG